MLYALVYPFRVLLVEVTVVGLLDFLDILDFNNKYVFKFSPLGWCWVSQFQHKVHTVKFLQQFNILILCSFILV